MASVVTMKQLLEAGVHFGHQTRRWNPKMKRFIFGERNGIYIIDLEKTVFGIEKSYAFVRDTVAYGGTILFVGTKKQAQEPIDQEAKRVGMPYVNQRWLGGMLTNFQTISKRLARLRELEAMESTGTFDVLPKKEVLKLRKEKETLRPCQRQASKSCWRPESTSATRPGAGTRTCAATYSASWTGFTSST